MHLKNNSHKYFQVTGSYTAKELEAYSKAGHVAEQSISSVRTVAAFSGEAKQAEL